MISQEKWKIFKPLQKFPENVGNLGKTIVATDSEKSSPNCNKLPNLVTLVISPFSYSVEFFFVLSILGTSRSNFLFVSQ